MKMSPNYQSTNYLYQISVFQYKILEKTYIGRFIYFNTCIKQKAISRKNFNLNVKYPCAYTLQIKQLTFFPCKYIQFYISNKKWSIPYDGASGWIKILISMRYIVWSETDWTEFVFGWNHFSPLRAPYTLVPRICRIS